MQTATDRRAKQPRLRWVLFWPGLSRLWIDGNVWGLAAAIGFSVLLNMCLVSLLIWPAWIPSGLQRLLWLLAGIGWLSGFVDSLRHVWRRASMSAEDPQLDLFLAARGEYLRGEWAKTEEYLREILSETPRDVESRLMLATLMRHQGRPDEAREHLRNLQRMEGATQWNMEIQREWHFLATRQAEQPDLASTSDPPLETRDRFEHDADVGRAA